MNNILEFRNVSKYYGSNKALDNFSHQFESGKIHALIGKNGSGKSTFIKLLSGAITPTSGEILLENTKMQFSSPKEAMLKGIGTVYQELSLVRELSVTENIFLGRLPQKTIGINWKLAKEKTAELLNSMGISLDPTVPVKNLSVGMQQVIEIIKAMSLKPKILLLDEPTSALASSEVEVLFKLLFKLKENGITMVYISHRLNELEQIVDNVTVLRDGIKIGSIPMSAAKPAVIFDMMFGEVKIPIRNITNKVDTNINVLEVKSLVIKPKIQGVSFNLHKNEILGIAGILGSGRTEILRAIFGIIKFQEGEIFIKGKKINKFSPAELKKIGLCYTSENRKEDGLVQISSVRDNLCMAAHRFISKFGVIQKSKENKVVQKQITDLQIKISSPQTLVSKLSGGNQQKVVVGNWLNTQPSIIFFDEPSRGIDVSAKQQIFQIIWEQANRGVSSIVVSTELEELLEVCDRILILRHGKIDKEIYPQNYSAKELYSDCIS